MLHANNLSSDNPVQVRCGTIHLPHDLLLAILEYVDQSDLPALCRVNKIIYEYVSDILYRDIGPHNLLAVCFQLWCHPHLAVRVRRFELSPRSHFNRFPHNYGLISNTLQRLPKLRTLNLLDYGGLTWMVLNCPFMLKSFGCGFNWHRNIIGFLESQLQLGEVTFYSSNPNTGLAPEALPILRKVSSPSSWLKQLVPGRPVNTAIFHDDGVLDLDITFLTSSATSIRALTIGSAPLRSLPLPQITNMFPELNALSVIDKMSTDLLVLADWICNLCSVLPELRQFRVVAYRLTSAWSDESESLFLEVASARAQKLEVITAICPRWPTACVTWRHRSGEWTVTERADTYEDWHALSPK